MSAPVNKGREIKPSTPRIAIMMAPRKALPKLFTSKPGTRAAASMIINALTTSANIPKVNTDSGAVINHNAGRKNAFINPSAAAANRKDKKFCAFMPGIINVAKPRPIAVTNQAINRAVTVLPVDEFDQCEKGFCVLSTENSSLDFVAAGSDSFLSEAPMLSSTQHCDISISASDSSTGVNLKLRV